VPAVEQREDIGRDDAQEGVVIRITGTSATGRASNTGADHEEAQALQAEGLDPDDPAVVAAIDMVRRKLSGGVDPRRAFLWGVAAVGELVRSTSGRRIARPPLRCPRGYTLRPGRMLVGRIACSCGRHLA